MESETTGFCYINQQHPATEFCDHGVMETIGDRVKKARKAANMSRHELAAASGVGYSTLSELERGGMRTSTKLRLIADALAVSQSWLETGQGDPGNTGTAGAGSHRKSISLVAETETPPGYVRFDLFEGEAGMGPGLVNQDFPEVVKTIEIAEWEVRRKLGYLPRPGRIQIITGRGPSMRPKLEDGDIVWIDTGCDYFDGDDYYLINVGGETQIKMLQKRGDGMYVVSINTEFPTYRPDPGDVTILGKALIHAGLRRF
ncbi:XRE family transcriptional regulator [Stenotrophomonas maltophilia]|uniref:XRE family transcriptional regulator n=1 Tax=Stenotrophomonas maltophilia TaxID=40324 RepID=UPI0012694B76|nr:helix-turn-helix transcriptional regulator [Stenotrophomonas maltophilia]